MRHPFCNNQTSGGFTLIELLVVISVIGLLSSVVMAAMSGARAKGTLAAGQNFDGHTYAAFYDDTIVNWDFNDSSSCPILDQSPNRNDLSCSGTAGPTTSPNPFKNGKSFSMIPSGAPYGSGSANTGVVNNPPAGNFSISFWVYTTGTDSTEYISNSYSGTISGSWRVGPHSSTNNIFFDFKPSGSSVSIQGPVLATNTWYHVALVCGAGRAGIYINGSLSVSAVSSSCMFDGSRPIYIRGALGAPNQYQYYLDNVRIYKQALPLSSIQQQYLAELPQMLHMAMRAKIEGQ